MSSINSYRDITSSLQNEWDSLQKISNDFSNEDDRLIAILATEDEAFDLWDTNGKKKKVLANVCNEILHERNQPYIDEWIENDPLAAQIQLGLFEKGFHDLAPTDRIAIIAAKIHIRIRTGWIGPCRLYESESDDNPFPQEIALRMISYFDIDSLLNLSRTSKCWNMSKEISEVILCRNIFSNPIPSFKLHSSFFYRHLINAGNALSYLTPLCPQSMHNNSIGRFIELQGYITKYAPQLKHLSLEHSSFGENALGLLPPKLETLSYSGPIKDMDIGRLPTTLKQLEIASSSKISSAGLANFPKSLEKLTLHNPIADFNPKYLPHTFKHLSLLNIRLSGAIGEWPPLKTLTILTSIDWKCRILLPISLEKLSFTTGKLNPKNLFNLSSLPNLQYLFLCTLNSSVFADLSLPESLTSLEVATQYDSEQQNLQSWDLSYLTRLTSFYAFENNEFARILNRCDFRWPNQLQSIKLSPPWTINSSDFISLPRKLKSFAMILNTCNSQDFQDLPPNLESLCLYFDHIDSETFSFNDLAFLPTNLRHLILGKFTYDSNGEVLDTTVLSSLVNLESLELTNINIDVSRLDMSLLKKLKKITFNFSSLKSVEYFSPSPDNERYHSPPPSEEEDFDNKSDDTTEQVYRELHTERYISTIPEIAILIHQLDIWADANRTFQVEIGEFLSEHVSDGDNNNRTITDLIKSTLMNFN